MWAVVRALVGICLVLLIVAMVVSPYVDLPLTTVGAQPASPWLLGAMAWAAVGAICRPVRCDQMHACEPSFSRGVHDRGLLGLTCALLC